MKIGYLGPVGTFSNEACDNCFDEMYEKIPCGTLQGAFWDAGIVELYETGKADSAGGYRRPPEEGSSAWGPHCGIDGLSGASIFSWGAWGLREGKATDETDFSDRCTPCPHCKKILAL